MKKKPNIQGFKLALNNLEAQLQSRRLDFTQQFSSEDTKHPDSWQDYGYAETLEFTQFYNMYKRNSFASAIINRPVDKCWQNEPWILTDKERRGEDPNQWEKDLTEFAEHHNLFYKLKELDRMQSIGQYGALLIEVRDGKPLSSEMLNVRRKQVYNFKVVSEAMLEPQDIDLDEQSERYGLPINYQLSEAESGDKNPDTNNSFTVHHSRLIVWAEGSVNDGIYGNSRLEPVWNTLINIEKVSGAGGEGYYKSARGSMTMNISTDSDIHKLAEMYGVDLAALPHAISEQVESFNRNFDSVLAAQGVDFKPLQITVPDPSGFMAIYKDELAACGIPLTVIIGQQTDERSSTENAKEWAGWCESRQNGFLSQSITRTIKWLQHHGIIAESKFCVCWEELYQISLSDKLDLVAKMTDANLKHAQTIVQLASIGEASESPAFLFDANEIRDVAGYEATEEQEMDDDFGEEEIAVDEQ